jgi:hypothetical protein
MSRASISRGNKWRGRDVPDICTTSIASIGAIESNNWPGGQATCRDSNYPRRATHAVLMPQLPCVRTHPFSQAMRAAGHRDRVPWSIIGCQPDGIQSPCDFMLVCSSDHDCRVLFAVSRFLPYGGRGASRRCLGISVEVLGELWVGVSQTISVMFVEGEKRW